MHVCKLLAGATGLHHFAAPLSPAQRDTERGRWKGENPKSHSIEVIRLRARKVLPRLSARHCRPPLREHHPLWLGFARSSLANVLQALWHARTQHGSVLPRRSQAAHTHTHTQTHRPPPAARTPDAPALSTVGSHATSAYKSQGLRKKNKESASAGEQGKRKDGYVMRGRGRLVSVDASVSADASSL